ncbi:hypothetical protein ACSSS7_000673 [Eimeria intestinalis]
MEDLMSGIGWGAPPLALHSSNSSSSNATRLQHLKLESPTMAHKLLHSPLPSLSSGNSSDMTHASLGLEVESSRHSRSSNILADYPYSALSAHRHFLAEPLHAAVAPSESFQQQTGAPIALDATGGGEAAQVAPSTPCGRETDTEGDADNNPLLPRRGRDGGKTPDSVAGAYLDPGTVQLVRNSSGAASSNRGDRLSTAETNSHDSAAKKSLSTQQEQGPPCASETASTAGDMPVIPKEDAVAPERLDELSLLSFNAGLLEYKLCGLRVYQNPPFTQRRLHHIPAALLATGADIICLQEVYGEAHADFIIESTRHKLPFVGRRTSGGRFSLHNGLLVLSKYPIVTYIERCFASKGMLEVAIDVPSIGVIAVFNMHLASGAVDPESRYVEDVRAAEIRQLLKACDAAADRGLIPLVIGDLNAGTFCGHFPDCARATLDLPCWRLASLDLLLSFATAAAPHLCASNYKCFVERGWRDCWLHVHGHQRHLLQHHLLHQQQLLDEQQLDDQGIELHDRHIRRDLFVRIRRQRRMQMHSAVEPEVMGSQPQASSNGGAAAPAAQQQQDPRVRNLLASPKGGYTLASDADVSDVEREQQKQLLGRQSRSAPRTSTGAIASASDSGRRGPPSQQRRSGRLLGPDVKYAAVAAVGGDCKCDSSRSPVQRGALEVSTGNSYAVDVAPVPPGRLSTSKSAAESRAAQAKSSPTSMPGLLGGYFGRAGGGMQLPFASELPAAAAWAHREFFLTAKRRLIEQQQKWLGGGDKAPVLDVRLSLTAPQQRQRGVDSTPLASDWSLASCSTAFTAGQCPGDTALVPAAMWRFGGATSAPAESLWHEEGTDGSVADWLLSDTEDEAEPNEGRDVVIECGASNRGAAATSCSRRDFTWDPENPLNSIGPHAGCHGLRCDYVFLPPHHFAGGLYPFLPVSADILLRDPRVLVDACCFGCFGEVMLVTLSDHYAVRITLRRSTDADIADFWGSCAAEAAGLRPPTAPSKTEVASTTPPDKGESNAHGPPAPWFGLSAV